MQYPIDVVSKAVEEFYKGISRTEICRDIERRLHFSPSEATVAQWINKFTRIALNTALHHRPLVGDTWVFYESRILLNWRRYWVIDIIDSDTTFLLATRLSYTRNIEDIRDLLLSACEITGKIPPKIINPGWMGYVSGVKLAVDRDCQKFSTIPVVETNSLHFLLQFKANLNDRVAVMHQLKKTHIASLINDGWKFYYNYFRSQDLLGNSVPAEKAGIVYPYKNWRELLQSLIPSPLISTPGSTIKVPVLTRPYRKRP
jgi:hypothetical protein